MEEEEEEEFIIRNRNKTNGKFSFREWFLHFLKED
jgi:hypothetical protein